LCDKALYQISSIITVNAEHNFTTEKILEDQKQKDCDKVQKPDAAKRESKPVEISDNNTNTKIFTHRPHKSATQLSLKQTV